VVVATAKCAIAARQAPERIPRAARTTHAALGFPMPYDLIIFDLDGMLADSRPFFVSAHNELADQNRSQSALSQ
jgi:hypothetical protein